MVNPVKNTENQLRHFWDNFIFKITSLANQRDREFFMLSMELN